MRKYVVQYKRCWLAKLYSTVKDCALSHRQRLNCTLKPEFQVQEPATAAGPAGGRVAVAAATATEEAPAAAVQAEGSLSGASRGRR
jgi:hypothetical protein